MRRTTSHDRYCKNSPGYPACSLKLIRGCNHRGEPLERTRHRLPAAAGYRKLNVSLKHSTQYLIRILHTGTKCTSNPVIQIHADQPVRIDLKTFNLSADPNCFAQSHGGSGRETSSSRGQKEFDHAPGLLPSPRKALAGRGAPRGRSRSLLQTSPPQERRRTTQEARLLPAAGQNAPGRVQHQLGAASKKYGSCFSLGTGTPPLRRWCSSSHSLRFVSRKL